MKFAQKFISIDGGLNGAIVVLIGEVILEKIKMPIVSTTKGKNEYDVTAIIEILNRYPDALIVIEKAQAMPKLGTVQAFNFGKNYGIMLGVFTALKRRYFIVHSKTWQTEMFRDMNYKDTKQASVIAAQRLFPGEDFTATERSKKQHDGITDALLLAVFAQRKHF